MICGPIKIWGVALLTRSGPTACLPSARLGALASRCLPISHSNQSLLKTSLGGPTGTANLVPQPAPLFLPFLHLLFFLLFSTSILIPGVELQATLYSFRSASSFTSNQSSLAVLFICFLQYLLSLCLFFYSIAPARAFYPLSPGLIKMTQIDLLACSFPPLLLSSPQPGSSCLFVAWQHSSLFRTQL